MAHIIYLAGTITTALLGAMTRKSVRIYFGHGYWASDSNSVSATDFIYDTDAFI